MCSPGYRLTLKGSSLVTFSTQSENETWGSGIKSWDLGMRLHTYPREKISIEGLKALALVCMLAAISLGDDCQRRSWKAWMNRSGAM